MKTKSFQTKEETDKELKQWAGYYDRSEGSIINEALEQYFEHQRWIAKITQDALDEIRAGTAELVPHAEVVKRFTKAAD